MIELLPIIVGVMLTQISPGPNMLAVSSLALGTSRSAGLTAAVGVAAGVFVWSMLFAVGTGAVLLTVPESVVVMQLLGGSYFLYLAIKALRAAFSASPGKLSTQHRQKSLIQSFLTGLIVVLTNPKAALMWVAISLYLASQDPAGTKFLVVGVCAALSALLVYGSYAALFSSGVAVQAYTRFFRIVECAFGAVFLGIAAKLIMNGIVAVSV